MAYLKHRFEIKYTYSDGCWLWKGATHKQGYGLFRSVSNEVMKLAHRVSYELYIGPIPEGIKVLHSCDVTSCVNPSHLFLGTQKDNMKDAATKGRLGIQNLSNENVHAIEIDFRKQHIIAKEYNISQQQVSRIKIGLNHKRN